MALEIYRAIGNRRGEAVALTSLGGLRMRTGDYPAALDALTTAAETYQARLAEIAGPPCLFA